MNHLASVCSNFGQHAAKLFDTKDMAHYKLTIIIIIIIIMNNN